MIRTFVKRPIGVLAFLAMLVIPGWWMASRLPVQLMPPTDIPELTVNVPAPSLSALEIERRIMPELRIAVAGMRTISDLNTFSQDGLAVLHCRFDWGCSMHNQYDLLSEAIAAACSQFKEIGQPEISLPATSHLPVATLMVSSANYNLTELSSWSFATGVKYFEQLEGVAYCEVIGESHAAYAFDPDFQLLRHHQISLSELSQAIEAQDEAQFSIMTQAAGAAIRLSLATRAPVLDSLRQLPVSIRERLFSLGQLGKITRYDLRETATVSHLGVKSLAYRLYQRPGAHLLTLSEDLSETIRTLKIQYPEITISLVEDQATWASISMEGMQSSLLTASFLAICLLFIVMKSRRAPFLMAMTIPISLGLTGLLFWIIGLGLNIMTLAGLTLGIGVLIDNGIVMVEQLDQLKRQGLATKLAAITASTRVGAPLLGSTLTSISIFIPLWLIDGRAAVLFQELGLAVALSLGSSLVVAVWILPVLSTLIPLKSAKIIPQEHISPHRLQPRLITSLFALLMAGLTIGFTLLPTELFPALTQDTVDIRIHWSGQLSLMQNDSLTRIVERDFFSGEECYAMSGTLPGNDKPLTSGESHLMAKISPDQQVLTLSNLEHWIDSLRSGSTISWKPADHALVEWLGNPDHRLRFRLYPPIGEIAASRQLAPAFADFQQQQSESLPFLILKDHLSTRQVLCPNMEALSRYQISPEQLSRELRLLSGADPLFRSTTQARPSALFIHPENSLRESLSNHAVKYIPASRLSETSQKTFPELIEGDLKGPFLSLVGPVGIRSEERWMNQLEEFLFHQGWGIRIDHQHEEEVAARNQLFLMFGIGVLLLFVMLLAQFESFVYALIVLSVIPFGVAGSLLLLYFTGHSLNMISGIGFIIVSGIVVNDAILKVETFRSALRDGSPLESAISIASARRKRAILLTSATTILAMVPILFSSGAGAELQTPMAISVIGGITLGTAAAMWWIPTVLLRVPPTK